MAEKLDSEIKILSKRRDMLFARVVRMKDYAKELDVEKPPTKAFKAFSIMYPKLEDTVKEIKEYDLKINELNLQGDAEYEPQFSEVEDHYDFIQYIAKFFKLVQPVTPEVQPESPRQPVPETILDSKLLLNKLEIPEFSGNMENWPHFSQLFMSLVHNNRNFSELHKVSYLVSKLKGNALKSVQFIPPTAENYVVIRELLWGRYDDSRVVADTYLDQIFNFSPFKTESRETLEGFLNGFVAPVAALKRLYTGSDLSDLIFLHQGLKVLDKRSRREFENFNREKVDISFDDLSTFIEGQLRSLNTSVDKSNDNRSSDKGNFKRPQKSHAFMIDSVKAEEGFNCKFCKIKGHSFANCRKIGKMSPWDRFKTAKRLNICLKCFSPDHAANDCTNAKNCKECGHPHNALLHYAKKVEVPADTKSVTATCAVSKAKASVVLLSTAQVEVKDRHGKVHIARFLLDSGSESHFVTSKLSKRLSLSVKKIQSSVSGLGGQTSLVLGKTYLSFTSRVDPKANYSIEPLIIDKIIDKLPSVEVDRNKLSYLKSLKLADENFSHPSAIDGIIGAELIPYILSETKIVDNADNPVAISSSLGWVLMGNAPLKGDKTDSVALSSFLISDGLPELLEKFWKLEEVPHKTHLTFDEKECEKFYTSTVRRRENGRFVVALPFRIENPSFGDSFHVAERRFLNLEKKLNQNEDMKISYHKVLKDYIDQGHLSLMENSNRQEGYFIPHHCVFKESTSTPMRIVFDASAKGSLGLSLNDALYTGPKLQADIFSLLVNFRIFKIALIADIKQMYRQIEVREQDRMYQKMLWRFSKDQPIQTYCHNTVVFGLSSSPYLALRTVVQLVAAEGKNFPVASRYIPKEMYMDDFVTSVENLEEASELHHQAKALFQKGGFQLVKWTSNFADQIRNFSDRLELHVEKNFVKEDHTLPILGLVWDPLDDNFHFKIDFKPSKGTKREILSVVARVYDPLGFLAPVMLFAKGLIKELWKEKRDWDDLPSPAISEIWEKFQSELALIPSLKFPRHLGIHKDTVVSLLGFCDASEKGYGAVIYVLVENSDKSLGCRLLCAKSKVAPSKTLSIPRLELCAALLLSRLIQNIHSILKVRTLVKQVLAFSDSEIVLCWLKSSPACWQTFVANRVAEIQDRCEIDQWSHVSGKQNPADCLSRGLLPGELPSKSLWWHGPSWILLNPSEWPIKSNVPDCEPPERKNAAVMMVATENQSNQIDKLIENCSDYGRLLRIMVLVLRFLKLISKGHHKPRHDLDLAELYLCKVVQRSDFAEDIAKLQNNRLVSKRIRCLNPFFKDEIIRVGGRLSKANLGFEHTHPILLPKSHPLVNRIIDYYHRVNLHTGPHLLLAVLRQRFWILSARSVVRQRIRSCNICFKVKPRPTYPIMADLPECRVNESKAFLHTGVDYAGPIKISIGRKRNPVTSKAYICLFVCLTTKAVHLELVSDLSTELFLSAFKRFLSRRGECQVMYSDNGTNFIGAKAELDELYCFISESKHQKLLNKGLEPHRIDWKFLPPSAPHFGGIWESNIKSVKTHLFKVIGLQVLTYEELNSILIQIESLLNSRPLCPLSADPSDPVVLTPAHFLMASPLKGLPSSDLAGVPQGRLSRFQLVDQVVQTFWSRWKKEYLHELQVRRKWLTDNSSVTKGTVVVVEQGHSPPLSWPLGVVEEIYPGADGVVRVVQVRTSNGCYKRPVVKVYPLPNQ